MADTLDSSEYQGQAPGEETGANDADLGSGRSQQVGPYLLVERLGGGAMATVYRGVDQRTNRGWPSRCYARMPTLLCASVSGAVLTHSNLNHPNIVQILDIGQEPR